MSLSEFADATSGVHVTDGMHASDHDRYVRPTVPAPNARLHTSALARIMNTMINLSLVLSRASYHSRPVCGTADACVHVCRGCASRAAAPLRSELVTGQRWVAEIFTATHDHYHMATICFAA